ncbi:MAG TPA: radical SAM protein, partial [Pyrinomonadaceae bacterium]
ALVPPEHEVVILDENIEPLDFERLKRFDVIGVTGLIVQADRMREILRKLRALPAIIAVGGPFVTLSEAVFDGLCDVRFIGEAEETWPAFLKAIANGDSFETRYEQAEKTDMSRVPAPRFDLLKRGAYASAPVQFSRGCPFLCEFCDIITIYGRRPRVKQPEQVIAELEALTRQGFKDCFLVDDNFIGNKLEAKRLLRAIIDWQEDRGYPLTFTTEASINLANDAALIKLMVDANFRSVFIGIESPRRESLTETRKHQNVHGDSLMAKVERIQAAGLGVVGGFIVGFDNDDDSIFDEQFEFIQASGIANLSISILTPLPGTPLYNRLLAEGRLDYEDPQIPFIPKQMSREQLKSGFRELLRRVFDPDAYFDRALHGLQNMGGRSLLPGTKSAPALHTRVRSIIGAVVRGLKLAYVMARTGQLRRQGRVLRRVMRRNSTLGANALDIEALVNLWISYWHFASVTRYLSGTEFGSLRQRRKDAFVGQPSLLDEAALDGSR